MYRPPVGAGVPLKLAPVLESWNAHDHPDQRRLALFLDEVEACVGDFEQEGLALELQVGLPATKPLTSGGGDLDNYLFPVVRRLGPARFDAVFGSKTHATGSTIVVGPAELMARQREPDMEVRTSSSANSKAWKEEVRDACAASASRSPVAGAIGLDIEFCVSPARNWTTLWKPAIDALGPVLGVPDPRHPFTPNDDRIVRLGLHRAIDESLGWDIVISAWWAASERL